MKLIQEIEACCASVCAAPLGADEAEQLAAVFKAIADPARLRLLSLIASCAEGEMCVCDLTEPLDLAPTVSHHLKVLADAGILSRAKRGTWVYYRVEPNALSVLRAALT